MKSVDTGPLRAPRAQKGEGRIQKGYGEEHRHSVEDTGIDRRGEGISGRCCSAAAAQLLLLLWLLLLWAGAPYQLFMSNLPPGTTLVLQLGLSYRSSFAARRSISHLLGSYPSGLRSRKGIDAFGLVVTQSR